MRADVRSGNAGHSLLGRSSSLEITLHYAPQGRDLCGVGGPCMSRGQHRALDKGCKTLLLHVDVSFVVKKSCYAECLKQVLRQTIDFLASEHTGKFLSQIMVCVDPVKEPKARYQWRGNDELSIRIAERIANKQPGPVSDRRKHDVQVCSKLWQDHSE